MKAIKFFCLASIFTICGCNMDMNTNSNEPETCENCIGGGIVPVYIYNLLLNIQDESGNSLIKNLECNEWHYLKDYDERIGLVNFDLYTLEIAVPEPCQDTYFLANKERPGVIPDEKDTPRIVLAEWKGNFYFATNYVTYENPWGEYENCPPADMITYRLSCPDLFGDNDVHELVTRWQPEKEKTFLNANPLNLCYHIELDGKEFTQITTEMYHGNSKISVATITLQK